MGYRISSDKINIFTYFISVIVLGSALLSLPCAWTGEARLSYLDAFFTATSAVCVTGLIVVDTAMFSRFGQTVILLLIQFGGLGIVTFATLYVAIPRSKVSLVNRGIIKEMYIDEVESNPRTIIRDILAMTISIEFIGFMIIRHRFKRLGIEQYDFSAAFHAISAFCNAGFSTFSDSLNGFVGDWVINLAFIMLIVLGGLGFVVVQDVSRVFMRTKRKLSYHAKTVLAMTGILILAGMAIFYMLEYDKAYSAMSVPEKLLAALFQSVTPRTAGFDTVPQSALSLPSVALVIFLMFTGGSPGSTAGGVKTTTIFMAIASAFRGYEEDGSIVYRGGALSAASVAKTLSVLARAIIIIGLSLLLLLAIEGGKFSFGEIFFEVVSAFGTVGLSRGVTADLGAVSKLVVIATMFMGRVGLFAMAINRGSDRVERFAEFPRESLLIG
ncbi:MAG: potassium transporter [Spirochaetae bacterium HGW-Spirochaetae-7]|jgi:trk system potassium uptake protein TrkH|nr:MAG: potassium transporter [Spirochaetae bacterium HGW-Spirochaetae-7]